MRRVLKPLSLIAFFGFFPFSAQAADINLTGTVKDSSTQKPISDASVGLVNQPFSTLTDVNGSYVLSGSSVRFSGSTGNQIIQTPYFSHNRIFFGVADNGEQVRIDLYNVSGRRVAPIVDMSLGRGNYGLNPFLPELAGQLYFVKIQAGVRTAMIKIPYVNNAAGGAGSLGKAGGGIARSAGLARIAAISDTLVVSAGGYTTARLAIASYTGENDVALVAGRGHPGTISYENGSYQSCLVPLVITVVDSDLAAATVPVKIRSTTDTTGITVLLKKIAGAAGSYSDSVWFSIDNSDSARHRIEVRDGDAVTALYQDASPKAVDSVTTTWTGVSGIVQPGGSPVLGVVRPLSIHVWDSDVTDSTLAVHVSSGKDKTGFPVTLHAASGSAGDFFGHIWFSLKGSVPDSVLAVMGATSDTILIVYHDETPAQDIAAPACIWLPVLGVMFLDSAAYHGTGSLMTINLSDDDIADSTAIVNVKSRKDPSGIMDTLHVTGQAIRSFVGTVGFTAGSSRPGFIAIQDGDSVVVSYQDDSPVQTVTQSATWNSK
jgi:hypothetical protein